MMVPATVVTATPLTVQPKGAVSAAPATAYVHVTGLAAGQSVHVARVDGQLYVVGRIT